MTEKEFVSNVIELENDTKSKKRMLDEMEKVCIITSEQKDSMLFQISVGYETSVRFYLDMLMACEMDGEE